MSRLYLLFPSYFPLYVITVSAKAIILFNYNNRNLHASVGLVFGHKYIRRNWQLLPSRSLRFVSYIGVLLSCSGKRASACSEAKTQKRMRIGYYTTFPSTFLYNEDMMVIYLIWKTLFYDCGRYLLRYILYHKNRVFVTMFLKRFQKY